MSVNLIVGGLPGAATFSKLIYAFKGIFKRIQIKKFWIRDLSDVYGTDGKQMTIEFTSNSDTRKARNFLDNLPFVYGKAEYPLEVQIAEESVNYGTNEQWTRKRRPGKRERPRSRSLSPGYSREASKLDMEIELLRKQRLVIEEERRLLLEQKKLEMIREYGPSASREFNDFEVYEPPRKRRHPEPVQGKKPRQRTPPPQKQNSQKNRPKGLPLFFHPCKKLIGEMKPFIEKDTTTEEAEILIKLIRAAIRKNLAIALEGKDYMPTGEIVHLYRERHPKEKDEAFVAKILANIRASYLTTEIKVEIDGVDNEKIKEEISENQTDDYKDKDSVTENQADNTKEVKNEGEGKTVACDEIAPQDTPAEGENGTDGETPDVGSQVKSEPAVALELENVSGHVAPVSEDVSRDVSQGLENVSKEVSQEQNDSGANLSTEATEVAVAKPTDSTVLDDTFVLDETEMASDLLGDELESQVGTDWGDE